MKRSERQKLEAMRLAAALDSGLAWMPNIAQNEEALRRACADFLRYEIAGLRRPALGPTPIADAFAKKAET